MKKICFICLGIFLLTACHHAAGTHLSNKVKECCAKMLPAQQRSCEAGTNPDCTETEKEDASLLPERKASLLTW